MHVYEKRGERYGICEYFSAYGDKIPAYQSADRGRSSENFRLHDRGRIFPPDNLLALLRFSGRHTRRISLDKPVYKEKLRLRVYGTPTDSSPVFLEIKKKYDGVVYKRRVSTDFAQAMRFLTEGIPPESGDYVARQVTAEMTHMIRRDGLIPRAAVFYDRRAFHGADDRSSGSRSTET